jgi:hypothetical protein
MHSMPSYLYAESIQQAAFKHTIAVVALFLQPLAQI